MNEKENKNTPAEVAAWKGKEPHCTLECCCSLVSHPRSRAPFLCWRLFALISEVKLPVLPGVRDGNCLRLIGSLQQLNPPLNTLCNCCCTQGSSPHHMSEKLSFTVIKESQPCAGEGDRILLESLSTPSFLGCLNCCQGSAGILEEGVFCDIIMPLVKMLAALIKLLISDRQLFAICLLLPVDGLA